MSDLINQTLHNRYQVVEYLGEGNFARVYKVWDADRAVFLAMKVLREDLAEDKVFLRRFEREGHILEELQHPHIVRFFGLEQEGDLAYMLMEFVEGITLRTEISRSHRPLPVERILEIMRPVCSALHYAHRKDRVHCDVKPANIMIHTNGNILLADFGIARMTETSTSTMAGAGSPAYMPPEQILGYNPTPQMDIYALGVVLFEMLTGGERPFTGEHAQTTGGTSEKVRWEKLHLAAPSPRNYNSQISPALEAIVLRCLANRPEDRFSSTLKLIEALESAISVQQPVRQTVPPPRPSQPPPRPPQPPQPPSKPIKTQPSGGFNLRKAAPWILLVAIIPIAIGFAFLILPNILQLIAEKNSPAPIATNNPIPIQSTPTIANTTSPIQIIPTDTFSPNPTPTTIPTLSPTETNSPMPPLLPVLGEADKIAFISNNDIWMANLDGSEAVQLTSDSIPKSNLQWTPDGQAINYIVGTCVLSVDINTQLTQTVTCFDSTESLNAFEIDPVGSRVAISLMVAGGFKNELFIVPYDKFMENPPRSKSDLENLAEEDCKNLAPYPKYSVNSVRWSMDGNRLAMVIVVKGEQVDNKNELVVLDVSKCEKFVENYHDQSLYDPELKTYKYKIENFGWNGQDLVLSSQYHLGFGELWAYQNDTDPGHQIVPLDEQGYYRDPQFSPDGRFLFFAFLDFLTKEIKIYSLDYDTIDIGGTAKVLPLEGDIFSDPNIEQKPLLALRRSPTLAP